ncbi:MAG: hypothetical protein M0Z75_08285 [Nitrospiraceae bacterium]|nr:hypothetical protein [Nitrospiraceae bacterium]
MKSSGRVLLLRVFGTVVVLGAFSLAGCATEKARYSPSEISGYPAHIQKLITEGTVEMGMTPDEVRFAWGSPSYIEILPPSPDGKPREQWTYKEDLGLSSTNLIFTDGKVTEMSSKGVTSKKFVSPGSGVK